MLSEVISKVATVKVALRSLCAAVVVGLVYLVTDMNVVADSLVNYYNETNEGVISSKQNFKIMFLNQTAGVESEEDYYNFSGDINIDASKFTATSVRLNTQAYNLAASVYNKDHIRQCCEVTNNFSQQVEDFMDPIMALAITYPEVGYRTDARYTWSGAIYSKVLKNAMNMDALDITSISSKTYMVEGLPGYLYCGGGYGCTAHESSSYHVHWNTNGTAKDNNAYNDNDSLGSFQILRHYIENVDKASYKSLLGTGKGISWKCGMECKDLMKWKDSLAYEFHEYSAKFFVDDKCWLATKKLNNKYHLASLLGVANNTGASFLSGTNEKADGGSLWNNKLAIYEYTRDLTDDIRMPLWQKFIDEWYEWYIATLEKGGTPCLAGDSSYYTSVKKYSTRTWEFAWKYTGLSPAPYIRNFDSNNTAKDYAHKTGYAVKMLLDYMSLERLYYSGEVVK